MKKEIHQQSTGHRAYYALFALIGVGLILYYFSDTVLHFTTAQQFPVNSLEAFPLTWLILPAEIFSVLFAVYFVYCLYIDADEQPIPQPLTDKQATSVAVLLPVYNEPADIIERTLKHTQKLRWPGTVTTYLLDDSTQEESKQEVDALAKKYGVAVVRREDREGYKAGNINHAIREEINQEYFVILDADQAPQPELLEETMDHFSREDVGYVQTPQHFVAENSLLERAAKVGANIFYHAQCRAKARDDALPFCGTNVIVRTQAFRSINGFSYYTSTEDLEVGLRLNERGWTGAYVAQVLVHGYTPPDFAAYQSQQYRWANGNLAVLRESLLKILGGRFTLRQQIHTLFTLGWWLIGLVSLVYVIVPLLSLWLGAGTHHTWLPTTLLVLLYINVGLGIGLVYVSLHGRIEDDEVTLRDAFLQYSLLTNSMFIYARAAINALLKRYVGFITTQKRRGAASLRPIAPNLALGGICFGSAIFALYKGFSLGGLQAYRTYLPISLWLFFYAFILASSILFVHLDEEEEVAA